MVFEQVRVEKISGELVHNILEVFGLYE